MKSPSRQTEKSEKSSGGKSERSGSLDEGSAANFRASAADILEQGWMTKRGESMFAGWSKRWFVLQSHFELSYFADSSLKDQKGVISLAGVLPENVKRVKPKSSDFNFLVETPKRKWQLNAGSQAEWDRWEKALTSLLARNRTSTRNAD